MCWVAGARVRPACPEGVEPRMGDHSREPEDPRDTTNHWKALGQLGALGSEWNEAMKRLARQTLHAGTDGATTLHRRFQILLSALANIEIRNFKTPLNWVGQYGSLKGRPLNVPPRNLGGFGVVR